MFDGLRIRLRTLAVNWLALITVVILLGVLSPSSARGQHLDTRTEFWPEIDVYVPITPKVRLFFVGAVSKSVEDGELRNAQSYEGQFGAHVDYLPNDHISLRAGYRYGTAVGVSSDPFKEHRVLFEQSYRTLVPLGLVVTDRNREDLRFINGDFSFRYRNRVTIEREFTVYKGRSTTPYVSGEIFYDTRFQIWNRNRWAVGIQQALRSAPLRKLGFPRSQVILDIYYMHQNDSRSDSPHVNALGMALTFHF
jgi:hypothetical protein